MDASKIVQLVCKDPENRIHREEFKKEFFQLLEKYGFNEIFEGIINAIYYNPQVNKIFQDLHREGVSANDRAEVLVNTVDIFIKKMLFNDNPK